MMDDDKNHKADAVMVAIMKKKGLHDDAAEGDMGKPDDAMSDAPPNMGVTPECVDCMKDFIEAMTPEAKANALADFIDMYTKGPTSAPSDAETSDASEPPAPEGM